MPRGIKPGTKMKAMNTIKAFVWDEIENELIEVSRGQFLHWLKGSSWPLTDFHHDDGVLEFRSSRGHVAFACYARSAIAAHNKLLAHKRYLEYNETEA